MSARLLLAAIFGLSMAAATGADSKAVPTQIYPVRGIVKRVALERGTVVVEHEAIPDYMEAMVMPFSARDEREIATLQPGDRIAFQLHVTADDGWIEGVKVLAAGAAATPAPMPDLTPIRVGQPAPDARLVDERGRDLALADYRGKALALTFIYTRCPFPTYCPLINNHFRATQALLREDATAPKNWSLLSITIDPERDTPEALAALAEQLEADPERWRFATGKLADITALTVRFGLNFWDDRGLIQHNLRTIVLDPDGTVRRVFAENQWQPAELAAELRTAAGTASKP